MRARWVVGLIWLFGQACTWAIELAPPQASQPLDRQSRYFIDPSAQLTIDQVEAQDQSLPWRVREKQANYNIDGKALWMQFDARRTDEARWYLELASSGLDRVQFFYRGPDGNWVQQEAGDTKPVSEWPLPGRFPTFELSPVTGQAVRYWVRAEHARVNFAAPISLLNQSALVASREREQFLLGAYFGLAALTMLVAAANGVVYRDRHFGAYALYVAALAAGQLAYLGVGAQHVWGHWLKWNEVATFVLPGVASATALWFTRMVTEPARFSGALDLAVWALIAGLLSAVALDTVLESRTSFALVMALTVLALAAVMALVALVWRQGEDPYIQLIAAGFLPVIIMAIFPVARGLNLIPGSALTRYGLSIGAAVEMPILFYALSLRGGRRREAQVRTAALSRNDALTGIAHARTMLHRLEGALARARSQKHTFALLVARIANFDAIVAEYGRETGDRALVVAASHLRHAISDVDLAARTGDHDFALLLEGPATSAGAVSCAQQVVASGLRPTDALPPGCTLKFHVAVATLPEKDLDAEASQRWLLGGVSAMPPDSRKAIKPMNF